ncbi:MAG: thioredoxin domain-containing protein, partial [Patescibacteria group bacterium]|nr:thioredoxin domain-containing protein [Patescibacteria group bacterium]
MPEENTSAEKKFELSPSISVLVAGVLVAGAIVFVNLNPSQPVVAVGEPVTQANIPLPNTNDYLRGSPDAPIVLVEYSDFQCPYCAMIHPTLKRIVEESNGQIAWIYRHLPLESIHQQALPAALAAECIGEQLGSAGFWAFADSIFDDQSGMSGARYTSFAQGLGADVTQFNACVASEKYLSKIDAQALEAQSNGGTGTPFTVVIAGDTQKTISGALPYAQIMAVI